MYPAPLINCHLENLIKKGFRSEANEREGAVEGAKKLKSNREAEWFSHHTYNTQFQKPMLIKAQWKNIFPEAPSFWFPRLLFAFSYL